ncbi:sulfotransferase family 2 domain-containing protein [Pseudomonas sp. LRF_L74]|uniref:sulfotransferase family 2 domain-containing protein n=1 Tax=Pseudomonas sp. LRF_L74 TaxID=3369422 RepID=UPI003F5EB3CE
MFQRVLWKLLPKSQRAFLLGRLSVVDRSVVDKSMSARMTFPEAFSRRSCLFIHVPKCAGTSVCNAMFDGWRPGHLPLYWYEQQFPQAYRESFRFTFVRDPLERLHSAYNYLRLAQPGRRDEAAHQLVSRYDSFNSFVSGWVHPENLRRQMLFAPQTDFLLDSSGHLAVDFIGRQERLLKDFRLLCERLGVEAQLQHLSASSSCDMLGDERYTARTHQLVRQAYQRDYELLGYE